MEELATCTCGHQLWKLYHDRIECGGCGRPIMVLRICVNPLDAVIAKVKSVREEYEANHG